MNEDKNENKVTEEQEENVTREINLSELYDGAVNNTIIIDPVTNEEMLLPNKKKNHILVGAILAVLILLILYYVSNKTNFGKTTKVITPKTTITTTSKTINNGTLTCTYSSKSDSETQDISFNALYENDKIMSSEFNYSVVSLTDTASAVLSDLTAQYENLFISNASSTATRFTFDKNSKGFTFNMKSDYQKEGFDVIVTTDGQTILFIKPNKDDTVLSLKNAYQNKGYTCNVALSNE